MPLQPKDAELIIGIVARIGTDTASVVKAIEEELSEFGYTTVEVHITHALNEFEAYASLPEQPLEQRYKTRIEACNDLRKSTAKNDIMARLAISKIAAERGDVGEDTGKLKRTAFVINQLKRPEETELLRSVYGEQYVQVSCHAYSGERERQLADRVAHTHPGRPKVADWRGAAQELIQMDEAQEDLPHGQRVRDVFPTSDVVIDAGTKGSISKDIERFFRALFGDGRVTPTVEEYGMQLATTASLRSSDLSRQVGAAILNEHREVQALGCNEVPKALGGTYWEGDAGDQREFQRGTDSNDQRKREVVLDLVFRLRDAGILSDAYKDDFALQAAILDRTDDIINNAQIMDSLEYGRTVHAEMNAVTDAARGGHAIRGSDLYCNTFPCHNCAKHIVAAGIRKVVYLRPYPKSYAEDLFSDSISVDNPKETKKVQFKQFIGIFGPMYERVFQKSKWKAKDGSVPLFKKKAATFVKAAPFPAYLKMENLLREELGELLESSGLAMVKPKN